MSQPASREDSVPPTRLSERIAQAVDSRTTPISQLLRLMSALDADPSVGANENLRRDLRQRLRARIGAPLAS